MYTGEMLGVAMNFISIRCSHGTNGTVQRPLGLICMQFYTDGTSFMPWVGAIFQCKIYDMLASIYVNFNLTINADKFTQNINIYIVIYWYGSRVISCFPEA
jgi:hypothetical protein